MPTGTAETPEERAARLARMTPERQRRALPTGIGSRRNDGKEYAAVYEPVDGKCNAHKTQGDGLCQLDAGKFTDHLGWGNCSKHGGSTGAGKMAAAKEKAVTLGTPLPVDPADALRSELARAAGNVEWLEQRVGDIPEDKLFDTDGRLHPLAEEALRRRKHLTGVAKTASDANIAERRAQLAESIGELVAEAIRRAFLAYAIPLDARAQSVLGDILGELGDRARAVIDAESRPALTR